MRVTRPFVQSDHCSRADSTDPDELHIIALSTIVRNFRWILFVESVCSRRTRTRIPPGPSSAHADAGASGADRIGLDGESGHGVGTAAVVRSPPVPRWIGRRRWLRRAGPVGPVGPVGSRKLAAAPGRIRAGQEDGVGIGIGGGVGKQRSGAECGGVRDDRVCVVQGSVHSGRRAQESSRSDRR